MAFSSNMFVQIKHNIMPIQKNAIFPTTIQSWIML